MREKFKIELEVEWVETCAGKTLCASAVHSATLGHVTEINGFRAMAGRWMVETGISTLSEAQALILNKIGARIINPVSAERLGVVGGNDD